MSDEEAINVLLDIQILHPSLTTDKLICATGTAIEALQNNSEYEKKKTPMPVIVKAEHDQGLDYTIINGYFCPSCHKDINLLAEKNKPFCCECGQALDWENWSIEWGNNDIY